MICWRMYFFMLFMIEEMYWSMKFAHYECVYTCWYCRKWNTEKSSRRAMINNKPFNPNNEMPEMPSSSLLHNKDKIKSIARSWPFHFVYVTHTATAVHLHCHLLSPSIQNYIFAYKFSLRRFLLPLLQLLLLLLEHRVLQFGLSQSLSAFGWICSVFDGREILQFKSIAIDSSLWLQVYVWYLKKAVTKRWFHWNGKTMSCIKRGNRNTYTNAKKNNQPKNSRRKNTLIIK